MSGFLVINPHSGRGVKADELSGAAESRGVQTHLLGPNDDPAELAKAAPEGPLGVAGGDGSLAVVAEVALERDLPFVVVPFGTRNHFARDLGLDRDDPFAALPPSTARTRKASTSGGRTGGSSSTTYRSASTRGSCIAASCTAADARLSRECGRSAS